MFVSQIETHETIRAFFPPGTVAPMHSSGIGKALLAAMDSERLDTLLINEPRPRFTDFTICNEADLKADLDATRQRGYSIDAEEKNIGMRCIAAPVFDFNGEAIAGISVSGPTARMHLDQTRHIASFVVQAALDLTKAIGGRVP
jgi:IclR family acetate operon transcriptional repressor